MMLMAVPLAVRVFSAACHPRPDPDPDHISRRWPNAIVLPGAAGRSANSNGNAASKAVFQKLQKELSEDTPCPSPRRDTHETYLRMGEILYQR